MAKKYRVGAIGFAHSHIESLLKSFADCADRVEMVAAADVPARTPSLSVERGTRYDELKQATLLYGMKRYEDYNKLLDENELDICCVCAENVYHPFMAELLLKKGITMVIEKPFAADMKGAMRMARAARASKAGSKAGSKAEIITNWPSAWSAPIRAAKELVDAGKIGRLFKFSYRNSDSQGPLSYGQKITEDELSAEWWYSSDLGGGSMLDYCCYGACMSCWMLGQKPIAAFGVKANINSHYGDAEDYAAIIARFANAVAHLEGSWTTVNGGVPAGPLLYGTEGTIVVTRGVVQVYKKRHTDTPDEIIEPKPLPAGRATLAQEIINHLDTGGALFPMLDLPLNLYAASILDAGARSAVSNKLELVGDEYWTIGQDPDLLIL